MDEPETTPAGTPETPPSATERLTGQGTKTPKAKAAKTTKAKADPATALAGGEEAEAAALGFPPEPDAIVIVDQKEFRVHCPKDATLPARVVKGQTAADAKEAYMAEMGIITPGHPLLAVPVGLPEVAH